MSHSRSPSQFQQPAAIVHANPYPCASELVPHWYLSDELMHDCPFNIKTCTGCDGSRSECPSEDGIDRRSEASNDSSAAGLAPSYLRSATPSSSIISFNNPATTRLQLREEFVRLFFPAGISRYDTDFMFTKLLCQDMLEDKGTTSRLAIDALALFNVGNAQGDGRMIYESRSKYEAAVRGLDADLADSGAMHDDRVLGAIYILSICEYFHPLCLAGRQEQLHSRGLVRLLEARGSDGEYSRYAQLLLYNARHITANAGLIHRTRVSLVGRHWKRSAAVTDSIMATLTEHLIALPESLERADAALHQGSASLLYDSMMELASYERSMQAWLLRWYSSFEKLAYQHEDGARYCHLRRHTRGAPPCFAKALRFPSFSHASAQVAYWTALLQIKQTIYEVNQRFKLPILPKAESILVSESSEMADKLCQSIAWLTQPRYGLCGVLRAHDAIYFACRWFTETLDLQKIAWCQKVNKSLETKYCLSSHEPMPVRQWAARTRVSTPQCNLDGDDDEEPTNTPP